MRVNVISLDHGKVAFFVISENVTSSSCDAALETTRLFGTRINC